MSDNGFVKVYSSILASSVWGESLATRVVWITMLAMADATGFIAASSDGIARYANVPLKATDAALDVLSSPDIRSKSQDDFEGRRIERVDGGFQVLNYSKYRDLRTDKQKQTATRVQRWRDRQKTEPALPERYVTEGNAYKRTEAEAETTFCSIWEAYPKRAGGNSKADALKAYKARLREGVGATELLAGVERYAVFIRATGKEGTEFVKLASTFLGAGQHYADAWQAPRETTAIGTSYQSAAETRSLNRAELERLNAARKQRGESPLKYEDVYAA